jgi:hypothetical protein
MDIIKTPNVTYVGHCCILFDSSNFRIVLGPQWLGGLFTLFILFIAMLLGLIMVDNLGNPYKITLLFHSMIVAILLITLIVKDPGILQLNHSTKTTESFTQMIYCDICDIEQLNNAKHCPDCACCIEEMQHHCYYIGKCIGRKSKVVYAIFTISWISFLFFILYMLLMSHG